MRVAIAGLAHFHVQYVLDEVAARPGHLALVGLADPDRANRETWARGREEVAFDDVEQMLAETAPDVVAVFDVYARRAAVIAAALDSGAAVIVDKPICVDDEQLRALEEVAQRTGGTISTIFEKRWYPETLTVRGLLAADAIGPIRQIAATAPHKLNRGTRPDWFFDERYGSILSDLLSHDIDLFLSLSGERSGTLAAWDNRGIDPRFPAWADSCTLLVSGAHASATMEANWLWPPASPFHGQYRMRVAGERGVIEVDWAAHEVTLLTEREDRRAVDLVAGRRPAQEVFSALVDGRRPEVDTGQSLAVARLGLLAASSARAQQVLSWSC